MKLFSFFGKKRPAAKGFGRSSTPEAAQQTFILEPILTPSGLLDSPDQQSDLNLEVVTHPLADLGLEATQPAPLQSSAAETVNSTVSQNASSLQNTAAPEVTAPEVPLILSSEASDHSTTESAESAISQFADPNGNAVLTSEAYGYGYGDRRYFYQPDSIGNPVNPSVPDSANNVDPNIDLRQDLSTDESPTDGMNWGGTDRFVPQPMPDMAVQPFPFMPTYSTLIGVIDTGAESQSATLDYSRLELGHDYIDGDYYPLSTDRAAVRHGTQVLSVIQSTQAQGVEGIQDTSPIWLSRAVGSGRWAESLVEFVDRVRSTHQSHAVVNLSFDLVQQNADGQIVTRDYLSDQELAALQYARDHQVLVVAAAGNTGGAMSALGQASQAFDNIITVGAGSQNGRMAYSSQGAGLALLADPMAQSGADGAPSAGTSISAARVTGAAALIWKANPELTYQQVIDLLKHSATDLETPGWDVETGFGVVNFAQAVALARQTVGLANPVAGSSASSTNRINPAVASATAPLWATGLGERSAGYEDFYTYPGGPPPPPRFVGENCQWIDNGWGYGVWRCWVEPEPSEPPPPPPKYLEFLQRILRPLQDDILPGVSDYMAVGKIVDDNGWYDFMQPVAHRVYRSAYGLDSLDQADKIGKQLAQQLRRRSTPAIIEFFPAKLLVAAKLTQLPMLQQQLGDQNVVEDVANLGRTYARLRLQLGQVNGNLSFLEALWQAQDETAIRQGAAGLSNALEGIENPGHAIRFLTLLLNAIQKVPALRQQVKDPQFLDTVIQLGLSYAKANPNTPNSNDQSIGFFLDTLWRESDPRNRNKITVSAGASQLGAFLKDFETEESRTNVLKYGRVLLDAARHSESLQSRDPKTLNELVRLGGVYASLDPVPTEATQSSDFKFFLNTLWQAKDQEQSSLVRTGGQELRSFLTMFDPPDQGRVLALARQQLQMLKRTPEVWQTAQNPQFVKNFLNNGAQYASLYGKGQSQGSLFFDTLWQQGDKGLAAASSQFRRFVQAVRDPSTAADGSPVNPQALLFGTRLLLAAKEAVPPSNLSQLVVPIAQMAREYTALKPEGALHVLDAFLNTVWQSGNGNSFQNTTLIQRGGLELREFLAGSQDVPGFAPEDQPEVLTFIAKTLKFVRLSPQLTAQQKQDPDMLRRWVSMARAYAQNRLNNKANNSPPLATYGINVSGYFLDTLWNTSLDNTGGIRRSVDQFAALMQAVNIDDQIRFAEVLTKVQKAFNYALPKLPQELANAIAPFVTILAILALVFAAAQANPLLALLLNAVVGFLAGVMTVLSGTELFINLFQFVRRIAQADVNDEGALQKAGGDLAKVLLETIGFIPVAPLFLQAVPRMLKLFSLLKSLDGVGSAVSLFKLFDNFGKNTTLLRLLDQTTRHPYLGQIASRLGQRSEVLDALIKVKDDPRLLEDVLKLGPKAIDDLAFILGKGADAAQIVRLRFGVPGMSIAELRNLLSINGMTPQRLEQLLSKLNNSLSTLKRLLVTPGMTPQLLLDFLEKMSVNDLRRFLSRMSVQDLVTFLNKMSVDDLKTFLNRMSVADLKNFLNQMSVADLKGFLNQMSVANLKYFLSQMTVADLKGFLTKLSVTELKNWISKLGINKVKELNLRYGLDAMKHYGPDWFSVYKGITSNTKKHVTLGDGFSRNSGVSGCHDTDTFVRKYIDPATDEKIFIHGVAKTVGPYTYFRYSMMKANGLAPKAQIYEKTTMHGLTNNWDSIEQEITPLVDELIRNRRFPLGVHPDRAGQVQYNGVPWNFYYEKTKGEITSIYPVVK